MELVFSIFDPSVGFCTNFSIYFISMADGNMQQKHIDF